MGMFDTVRIRCPSCENITEEQTKSGPCDLSVVGLDNVDPSMIAGLAGRDGKIWCKHCNKPFVIEMACRPVYRATLIEEVDHEQ